MPVAVEFRPEVVQADLPQITANLRARLLSAIERRLITSAQQYGVRLRQSLKELWKIRVGDYRVVYSIQGETVTIWAVLHRREVYREAERRWRRRT